MREVVDRLSTVYDMLKRNEDYGITWRGMFEDDSLGLQEQDYKISDFEILFGDSQPELGPDGPAVIQLAKPRLVLFDDTTATLFAPTETDRRKYIVEFQILVNAQPSGRAQLAGYTCLFQLFSGLMELPCEEYGYWTSIGLIPMKLSESPIYNGGKIHTKLQDRLLIKSIVVIFNAVSSISGNQPLVSGINQGV